MKLLSLDRAGMTVADLRATIKGLPGKTPVLYQRIEDKYFKRINKRTPGWKTIKLLWEGSPATSEYIRAWCAFKTKYKGRNILGIDAHY